MDAEQDRAIAVRKSILDCLYDTGGGHYGGSLSVVDILLVLARDIVGLGPDTLENPARDRLLLSKGHAAVALYAVYQSLGLLQEVSLSEYGVYSSGIEGHPDMLATSGIDFSTGSLGQGVSAGAGMAIALRSKGAHIWVIVGDGECQEGQVWEAALFGARYNLSNLHVIVDANGAQEIGWQHDPSLPQEPMPQLGAKWSSFGWIVRELDGHDQQALRDSLLDLRQQTRAPSVIIARTRKGKGVKCIEADPVRYHCIAVDEKEHQLLLAGLYA